MRAGTANYAHHHPTNWGFSYPKYAVQQLDRAVKLAPQEGMARKVRDIMRNRLTAPPLPDVMP